LEAAKGVVVLWSESSLTSDWVKSEALAAAERGVMIPALLDRVKIPLGFRRTQAADLVGFDGDPAHGGFQDLCSGIAHAIGGGARMCEPFPRASPPSTKGRRSWHWPVGASVLGLLAVGLGLYLMRGSRIPDQTAAAIVSLATDAGGPAAKPVSASLPTSSAIETTPPGEDKNPSRPDSRSRSSKPIPAPEPASLIEASQDLHTGYVYPDCKGFSDPEAERGNGPMSGIDVYHGAFIHGLQIHYKGRAGRRQGFLQAGEWGIRRDSWTVPPGEKIIRIEGAITGYYLSRLQFFTDRGHASPMFGQPGGQSFTSSNPKNGTLMTLSGWADTTRHGAKARHRAICGIRFHFGVSSRTR
jgi:hypothetical protein